jgi:DNA invertase Pin-like site-specific DNA recombinase
MSEINKVLLLIDDGPSLVNGETQERMIRRALTSTRATMVPVFIEFDAITDADALLRLAADNQANLVATFRLLSIRSLASNFVELCEFISDLKRSDVDFVSIEEGINTEAAFGKVLEKLVLGWRLSREKYRHENPKVSQMKARLKGTALGRPKRRDDEEIGILRGQGMSIRSIAAKTGVSTAAVQRALKSEPKDR